MKRLTELQKKCCRAIATAPNSQANLDKIARKVGTGRLGVSACMRSLEKHGYASYFPSSRDQWSVQIWFLTTKGKAEVEHDGGE